MLSLAATRKELRVVDDQRGCPTSALDLADAIMRLAAQAQSLTADAPEWGVYHATGSGETTWCGFAREIFAAASAHGVAVPQVHAIATSDYPTPARRPANSRLDCGKLSRAFAITLPDWRDSARRVVERLVRPGSN